MRFKTNWWSPLSRAVLVHALFVGPVPGQPSTPKWELLDGDCQVRVLEHVRRLEPPRDDLQFIAGHGMQTYAYVQVPHAAVIPELRAEVPVRADRTGLQIVARVVLPRAINASTRGPYTLLVTGDSYKAKHQWQPLVLADVVKKMERGIRALQLETSQPIDAREAYIDMVLVNLYAGPGSTRVQLQDVALEGAAVSSGPNIVMATWSRELTPPLGGSRQDIRISGNRLLIKGQPFLARMIDDNGEDWGYLRELGINTIRLMAPASVEQMACAESHGLWIVCPPPGGEISAKSAIHWRRVLAWDVSNLVISDEDVAQVVAWSRELQRRDGLHLPILCDTPTQPRLLSRAADILVHYRATLGTEFTFGEYADWVSARVDQSHPGSVHWMGVDTQLNTALRQQVRGFGCPEPLDCEFDQLQILTRLACGGGIRGVYFRSATRLDPQTNDGRQRALAIQQANLDLDLMQPWLAVGQASPIPAPQSATMRTHAWQSLRGRARLVSVVLTSQTSQYCGDPPLPDQSLVIPGVADIDQVFLLSAAGMPPLPTKLVPGGVEVRFPLKANTALLLVTSDANVVRELADQLNRAAATMTQLAGQRLDFELADELREGRQEPGDFAPASTLGTMRDEFQRALGQQNFIRCDQVGNELFRRIAQRRFDDWQSMSSRYDTPAACPLATQPSTRRWLERLQCRAALGDNLLNLMVAGGCDSIEQVRDGGWQLYVGNSFQDVSAASIVTEPRHRGAGCLQLVAGGNAEPGDLDGRPWIWASTPPTRVTSGQILRLEWWTRFEKQEEAAELLVYDSLAGPSCGLRCVNSGDWEKFTLYRATEMDTPLTMTFALTGPGRAWIDDVSVSLVQPCESLKAEVAGRQFAHGPR